VNSWFVSSRHRLKPWSGTGSWVTGHAGSRVSWTMVHVGHKMRHIVSCGTVTKRYVLEQNLLFTTYRKSHIWIQFIPKWMTWPLFRDRIKVTSTIASHSPLKYLARSWHSSPKWCFTTLNKFASYSRLTINWVSVDTPQRFIMFTNNKLCSKIYKILSLLHRSYSLSEDYVKKTIDDSQAIQPYP